MAEERVHAEKSAVAGGPVPPPAIPPPRPRRRRWRRLILLLALVLVVGVVLYYWFFMRPYESTDDAFIESDAIPVAPQVPGRVLTLAVRDNEAVQAGQLLIAIDSRDYDARLAEARADLEAAKTRREQARTQVAADEAKLEAERANVTANETEAQRAEADLQRYQSLQGPAVSKSQLDLAATQARSSGAGVDVARSRVKAAEAQVALSKAGIDTAAAEVQRYQAAVQAAELEVSYTKVTAPESGFVTHRTIDPGAYVQIGQTVMALVPTNVYVIANFKETQLTKMRPGQPVDVDVDAYPHHTFHAHVDSIQRGSGARFSLLPPENATGNYVKVVQRVPVKIVFDEPADPNLPLGPGMSVVPTVNVLAEPKQNQTAVAETH